MGRTKKDPALKQPKGWAYTIRLLAQDVDLAEALKTIAAANYMSINDLIIHAVRLFVAQHAKGTRFTIEIR